jgi:3-isopropylmalate dehydrogenase
MSKKILILEGDGIGPEIIREAVRVMDWLETHCGIRFERQHALIGGIAIDREGAPISEATMKAAHSVDAILFGAVGGPQWESLPFDERPERGILRIRKELSLFGNIRVSRTYDALVDASTLRPEIVRGLDLIVLRENIGGMYFGEPRGIRIADDGSLVGINTHIYTDAQIQQVARLGFELARARRRKVCSVDKANVMEAGELWRRRVQELHDAEFADVELTHMYADNCAMQLVRRPSQFDVILTDNLFGDILSDCAAMLAGSLGMLPSASVGEMTPNGRRRALYEPIHGSAPDIAGQNIANPLATILSLAMLLRTSFGLAKEAALVEAAVEAAVGEVATPDIARLGVRTVSTVEMGDCVLRQLDAAAERD